MRRPHKILPTNPHADQEEEQPRTNPPGIGFLRRPWQQVKSHDDPEAVFVLAKRNYKVYANIGLDTRHMTRFMTVLDTGAGSSFIRLGEIPHGMRDRIQPLPSEANIRNASGKPVPIMGTIDLQVQIGSTLEKVTFLVADKLAVAVILGCDFCDKHVEAIKPRLKIVEMDTGSIVPIVLQPTKSQLEALLPEDQQFQPRKPRTSPKIKVRRRTKLPPPSQTWVEVTSPK